MIDLERTHRIRRAINGSLQQSQKSESHAAEQCRQLAVNGKRDLLLLLSKWLMGLNSASAVAEVASREIQSLTRASLGKWVQLQMDAVQNEKDLRLAEGKEREAIAVLQHKAPFGAATKVFAGAEAKSQIKTLQDNVAAAHRHCESLSRMIEGNTKNKQALAEAFLRDCLKQREKLATTRALGKEAGAILDRMTNEINAIWVRHRKQQAEDLDRIAKLIEGLRESYKDLPTSPARSRKALSFREQSDKDTAYGTSYDFKE